MLKTYFNRKAFEALAKELRRASWSVVAAGSALVYGDNSRVLVLIGASAIWIILQICAFTLESIKDEKGDK